MKNDTIAYYGDFPADLCAGKHLILIYTNATEYLYVVDAKAPMQRVIDSEQGLQNGSSCVLEPTHRIVIKNLNYKKLLSNTIQSISIELRTEMGQLDPLSGTGKVILTLQFKKCVDYMDSYYTNQASSLTHFFGHYRQRASGFGVVASGIGCVALPPARKFVLPAAKRIGKELLLQCVPELMDVIGKKKSPKQAPKKHHIKHSKKTNRWIFSPPNETEEKNEKEFKTLTHWTKESNQTQNQHFTKKSTQKKSVGLLRLK